jgi:hypothetical protein
MDWITILALVGIALAGAILFRAGWALGRSHAQNELRNERHQKLVVQVRNERLERDKKELARRLTASRRENYEYTTRLLPSEEPDQVPIPIAQRGTLLLFPPDPAA